MKKLILTLICSFAFIFLLNGVSYSIDIQNIPADVIQKAKENPDLAKEMLKKQQEQNQEKGDDDKDKNLNIDKSIPPGQSTTPNEQAEKAPGKVDAGVSANFKKIIKQENFNFNNLKLFGASIFSGAGGTIPDQNVMVSGDYVIGPSDSIVVYLWGRISATINMTVNPDGSVYSDRFGKIYVAGKKFNEVREIFKGIISGMEGVEGDVSIGKLRTIRVMVLGEVENPGFQTLSSLSTIATAISFAGGVNKNANIRNVKLKRNGKVIKEVDYYDLALYGKTFNDTYLQANDVIFVPDSNKQVFVAGEVNRNAIYELKKGETLGDVLKMAGGVKPTAFGSRIKVKRFVNNNTTKIIDVSLKNAENIKLKDGDRISVIPITTPEENVVYLKGNVYFPGSYAIGTDTKVSEIIGSKENLKPNTATSYAFIRRLHGVGKETKVISFKLEEALENPKSKENIDLKSGDEIYVLNIADITPKKVAEITGEVVKPGIYSIEDNVTLKDIINKAGGFNFQADRSLVEIIRKVEGKFITKFINFKENKNFSVKPDDQIIVHSIYEKNPKKYVEITGEVNKPGSYLLTKNMTIEDLIIKAGGLTRMAYPKIASLQRFDKLLTVNLFSVMNSDKSVALKDKDRVYIYNWENFEPLRTVQIVGGVNEPGKYQYSTDMMLKDLIFLAGNLTDKAYLKRAEIVRMKVVEGEVSHKIYNVNLSKIMMDNGSFRLEPYDTVKIRDIRDFNESKTVVIKGEVKFPGEYVIRDNEKLYDVIMRAGGVTQKAFMEGLVFKRDSVKEIQKENLLRLRDRLQSTLASVSSQEIASSLDKADIAAQKSLQSNLQRLINRLGNAEPEGRIVVDIDSVKDLKDSKYNVALEDGDEIVIPQKPSTVNVVGEVYNPSSYIYTGENTTVKDYLDKSGGITDLSSEKNIYVVRADGSVVSNNYVQENYWWKNIYSVQVNVGDTIVVPRKLRFPSYMQDAKDITQILYQTAATVGITMAAF